MIKTIERVTYEVNCDGCWRWIPKKHEDIEDAKRYAVQVGWAVILHKRYGTKETSFFCDRCREEKLQEFIENNIEFTFFE